MPRIENRKQSKHWIWTLNNPGVNYVPSMDGVDYMIIGYEVSRTGTPHYQGYIVFSQRKRMVAVKKHIPRAHVEIKLGTVDQAIKYSKKDGDYKEWGTVPLTIGEGVKERWDLAKANAIKGNYDEIPSDMLIRYYHSFRRLQQDNPIKPPDLLDRDNVWIVAPTSYGKSTYARKHWPNFFDKPPTKWFTGYKGEATILCDDFGPNQCKYLGWYMKRWADKFSFPMETKGGGRQIRPLHIVVTSQYTIDECFEDYRVAAAMKNRFKELHLTHWEQRALQPTTSLVPV